MGWLLDTLKEVPLSAVLKERIALAEQKYDRAVEETQELRKKIAELEQELAELRAKRSPEPAGDLSNDLCQVLVYLFRATGNDRDVGALAQQLQMERGVAVYHLEQLDARGLVVHAGGNYLYGHVYWVLTPEGRRYVVENGLISG